MGDKIQVLSVCTSDSYGGAARAAYRIHCAVRELGIDSYMFVKFKGMKDANVLTLEDFIPHNPLYSTYGWMRNKIQNKIQHLVWGKYPNRSNLFMSDLRSTDIHGALRKLDYDILHLHWINQRFLPLAQLPKDKPIVWTLHDSWPFCGICHLPMDCQGYQQTCGCCPALGSDNERDLSFRVWSRKAAIYRKLDLHIVTPSRWMANCARKSSLFGDLDVRVIPNCIDVDTFYPGDRETACRRLKLDPEKKHILFGAMNAVGDKNKGFHYLVRALDLMGRDLAEEADLVVFGTSHPLDDEIGGLRVHSLGMLRSVDDIVAAYRAATVTVVPSLSENLSCTIMESMACGTSVTAFAIGGNEDLIDHRENGYLAGEKDSRDLAEGIRWCIRNRPDLSMQSVRKVLKHYTPEVVAEEYRDLYLSLNYPL